MAFVKGKGGRPKGANNKKDSPDQRLVRIDGGAVVAPPRQGASIQRYSPLIASPGIDAVNLLSHAMIAAWEEAYRKNHKAEELEPMLETLEADLLATPEGPERAALALKLDDMKQKVTNLRLEAGTHVGMATSLAEKLAP
jgi:hypothetical protein